MFQAIIESLLEERIGLSAEAVGSETIAKAIRRCMNDYELSRKNGIGGSAEYLFRLQTSEEEWEKLVETVVVPETWFFRNKESFSFLGGYVRFEWLPQYKNRVLRVLSLPCSTGEEPYSIAMTFLDMGIPEGVSTKRFHIDGVDISEKSIKKAREGIYGRESFRGEDLSFRDRYFDKVFVPGKNRPRKEDIYRVHKPVRNIVRFIKGNALESGLLSGEKPYDIIFCRNLFIYLSEPAKRKVMEVIDRLLAKDGILFVGHVERPLICASTETVRFVWIRQSGVFACRRAGIRKKKHGFSNMVQNQLIHRPEVRVLPPKPDSVRRSVLPPVPAACGLRPAAWDLPPVLDTGADALLKTARELADKGFLNEAFQLCDKCLNEDPFNSRAHFLTGLICHALSDEDRAEEHFNKTVYLDPNHHEALSHLAFIMDRRGDFSRAEHLRRRVQRILQKEEKD